MTYTLTKDVSFAPEFLSVPVVSMALKDIKQESPEGSDVYGWGMYASGITKTGFKANLVMEDRNITTLKGTWIACVDSGRD